MKIIRNKDINPDDWNVFVKNNPHGTPFQTREFYHLFNSVPGLAAEAIAITDDEKIRALAVITKQSESGLKGYFSRRCIIYGGPLADNQYPHALAHLLNHVNITASREVIYTETRNLSSYEGLRHVFLQNGYLYKPYLNFIIRTGDTSSAMNKLSSSRRRQIRKALNSGVTWKIAENLSDVITFYNILEGLYKRRIRKPLLPVGFFEQFLQHSVGKYLLVCYNNSIIGGIMCPMMEGKAIYEMYICGLDDEYKEQYPSVMATWAAIEYAVQNRIPVFDFMGAGAPGENYGVRDFKERFGGEMVEFGRFVKINRPLLFYVGKVGLKLMGGRV